MKKLLLSVLLAIATFGIIFTSCRKDGETLDLSKDIQNIVPDSTLNKIIALGMPINKGTKPTDLRNIYEATPYILKATNVPNDFALGYAFADYKFRLYDQDNDKLTIKLDYVNGPESGTGIGGFVSGNGSDFSVFVKVHAVNSGSPAEILQIISGTITADGIKNFYFSNFMLEDYGDPKNLWINKEQGRVIYDSDGTSPVITSFKSKDTGMETGVSGSSEYVKK
jgi:hypothetical protein